VKFFLLLLATVLVSVVTNAQGEIVLAAEFDPTTDPSGSGISAYIPFDAKYHAQVFTVGASGKLVSIELLVLGEEVSLFELFPVSDGFPNPPSNWTSRPVGDSSLGHFIVDSTGNDGLTWWSADPDLGAFNIQVSAGDQLSFISRFRNGSGFLRGSDYGSTLAWHYPGNHYKSTSGYAYWELSEPLVLGFRVFVETGPTLVTIDIKPTSDTNSINLCSRGTVPIAILGSDTFDVYSVNTEDLRFSEASVKVVGKKDPNSLCSFEDVDDDIHYDLVCHFITADIAGIDGQSSVATVNGELFDGTQFAGTDSVNIVKDSCN
jgi:hypothetical protein